MHFREFKLFWPLYSLGLVAHNNPRVCVRYGLCRSGFVNQWMIIKIS